MQKGWTAEQAQLLDYDCEVVQGFYFSKPKPFDEIDMQKSWEAAVQ